ncbi:MAG: patatin-like phospholipase family protein, partial [Phycisphaeraceae bacterium]|nr:patatin-like phospholipase family protein [Phycisphaeraceae bacterium]
RDSLKSELTEVFKDQTIESIWSNRKIALCIPTTNMSQDQPWVFKTPHLKGKTRDNKYTLIDVCLATAAAPIFFPLAVTDIPDADNKYNVFSDGGLWANNPVMIGMTEALEIAGPKQPIEIISIGTCATKMGKTISKSEANWGLLKWKGGTEIVSASLGAQSYGYGFIAQQLSKHLDRPCTVVRLPNSPPSPEQAALIGLDKASENSCKAMTDLGRNDAEALHGRLTRGDKNLQIVQDIFTSLCEFS